MCGIFGQLSTSVKPFDSRFFRMAGILNDLRGGDSCGVMINRTAEYGIDNLKMFQSFKNVSELIFHTEECDIAIGHTRKASVGKVDIASAQPVCIYNDAGTIDFVLIHNGTIKNYKDLNEKYKTNCPAHYTDSMVMADIMYNHGYDVLGEYFGAAAMVIIDYRGECPDIMLFKGKSKQTTYAKEAEEERPLFYVKRDGVLYFSSLFNVLDGMFLENAYTLKPNTLCRLVGEEAKLIVVKTFDRESLVEPSYGGYGGYQGSGRSSVYDDYDYEGNRGNAKTPVKVKKVKNLPNYGGKIGYDGSRYVKCSGIATKPNERLHGSFVISEYGYELASMKSSSTARTYHFFDGILMKSESCMKLLDGVYGSMKDKGMVINMEDFLEQMEDLVGILSYHEILCFNVAYGDTQSPTYWKYDMYSKMIASHKYTGEFIPLFDSQTIKYAVDNGEIVSYHEGKELNSTNLQKDRLEGYSNTFTMEFVIKIANEIYPNN